MLGSDIELELIEKKLPYYSSDIEIDITNLSNLREFVKDKKIDWIINCSAYTAVDRAEDEKDIAFKINSEGVYNIAAIAKEIGSKLIHISTDYVFNGEKKNPYSESDQPNPIGVYGRSKLEGERKIRELIENYFIIRTSWLYGKHGNNFVHTMIRLFNERDKLNVVSDQFGSPTWTKDLAGFILKIVVEDSSAYGIYHYSNEGIATWFEFAEKIYFFAKKNNQVLSDTVISPIMTDQYPTKAKRPVNSCLSKEKAKMVFNISIPEWQESLLIFMKELQKEKL